MLETNMYEYGCLNRSLYAVDDDGVVSGFGDRMMMYSAYCCLVLTVVWLQECSTKGNCTQAT